MSISYIVGDTRDVTATIPDGSVDLIFTSPPFLALRSYLPADHVDKHREIGSEANPATFLDTLLGLTAEWGRVLAPHGTLAVELGDTYSGAAGPPQWDTLPDLPGKGTPGKRANAAASREAWTPRGQSGWPLAKSLALIPQLYAVALAYGLNPLTGQPSPAGRWRVRNWIAWHRPNPPVGALGDKWRPASSYITTACRSGKRWFDLDSVRTEFTDGTKQHEGVQTRSAEKADAYKKGVTKTNGEVYVAENYTMTHTGAPPLDWHTDGDLGVGHIILTTQPYAGSHYATFPMELPRKIIDCMCPRAVCRVCGVPRERIVGEASYVQTRTGKTPAVLHFNEGERVEPGVNSWGTGGKGDANVTRVAETLGWSDCGHNNYRPGHVLDPFCGTGTTLAAAQDLGRDATGIDIDEENAWLARERCGMFATFEHFERPVVDTAEL